MHTAAHYNSSYYETHYAHVLNDPGAYTLLAAYWRRVLFEQNRIPTNLKTLDFGCGPGHISAGLQNVVLYDPSPECRELLRKLNRCPADDLPSLGRNQFDIILSSHSLEHSLSPAADLNLFRDLSKPGAKLVLVLPIEVSFTPSLHSDSHQHFYCWTFQTITNLLLDCGWRPLLQRRVYGPFGLRTLRKWFPEPLTVAAAELFGRILRQYPSILTVAEHT